ncbi:glycoside hydrolase family 97 protein [Streptomyces triticirhizae]|uniref:Alpha-galactosidase n=1 Tax=Streptomyces triticirhizae TaxID=2483353 RepID=A0A3M2MC64_9ACTN|nr:glycoside hydrolase family 97 protein [Streptomyces triticirhizae]RMI46225.1 alpha-galactosidase [Streptomyces triticirhizae]
MRKRQKPRAARAFPVRSALVIAVAAGALQTSPAHGAAPETWTVSGPAGPSGVSAEVTLDEGALSFSVASGDSTVLSPAPIGIETDDADLTRDLEFAQREDRTVTESYAMTTGKSARPETTYTETTLSFTGENGAALDIVVRASDTGAAYRYVLPGSGTVTVNGEASTWSVPADADAWLVPEHAEDQGRWLPTTAGAAPSGDYAVPALFEVDGTYALLAETDLDGRYAGARLTHEEGSATYTTTLEGDPVTAELPLATPWRTAAIGDLATVTESSVVDDLAPPSRIEDTSWIEPGTVAWSWLTEHSSPGDPDRQREYIDFAQRNGWDYVLIDEGWDPAWVPEVVDHARERGVGVILWFHSDDLDTAEERAEWLPLVRSWGVAGLKVDFAFEFVQPTLQWYDAILAETAEHELMVNFHGSGTLRGTQRTWPHVMTSEAVFGAEQQQNRAALNTILPFTRNVVSSMDFTPVTFSIANRDTTDAHELATALVFESGWQHLADNPESYQLRPEALRVLNQLPTAWDETRLLGGQPGQDAYLARRGGDTWYVGGIRSGSATTFETPLSFLGDGEWLVETVRDGDGGLVAETSVVTGADTLSVPVAENGGFATVVCPATEGASTCGGGSAGGLLRGAASGRCVDVPDGERAGGTPVALWDCNGGANQVWTPTEAGELRVHGDSCLDTAGGATENGTAVVIEDCDGAPTQRWSLDGTGPVVNEASGTCLDAYDTGTENGTPLVLWPCGGAGNQSWTLG